MPNTQQPTSGHSSRPLRLKLLQTEDLERIHAASLKVLAETGIVLHYPPARQLLARQGAIVDEARELARIPRALVEEALKTVPRHATVFGHTDPRSDCELCLDGPRYGRTTTALNWIVDARSTHRRPVEAADVVNWTRVMQEMPNINFAGSLNDQEEAVTSAEVRCMARMLALTDKPLMFSAFSGEGMRWLWRLTEVAQPAGRLPRLMVLSSVNSPLNYGWGQCEAAMASAELGLPVCVNSSAVAGATAPVTLAGCVVQMNAEMLAALTILQLHRPGCPVVYAGHPMAMDMKTGNPSISTAEVGLMSAACIEVGRAYGLPTGSNGICTDACTPDPVGTVEKWASGFLPFAAGANVNGGAGSLACVSTVSLEQLMIDNDVYGDFHRQARGFTVDEESLAGDVIAGVGPGNSYMMADHTLAHFRRETYNSPLANRFSAPTWEAAGAHDAMDRAASTVSDILASPPKAFLSDEQLAAVDAILALAVESLAKLQARI